MKQFILKNSAKQRPENRRTTNTCSNPGEVLILHCAHFGKSRRLEDSQGYLEICSSCFPIIPGWDVAGEVVALAKV